MVLIGSSRGRMAKFNENEVRTMGRTASGVKGIELDDSTCIGAEIASEDDAIMIITKKGYGKQTNVCKFRETKRGSKGVKALNVTEKNGDIASFKISRPDSDLVIVTDTGMVMRMSLDQINTLGRVTQGVRLIKLKDEQTVATISIVDKEKEEPEVSTVDSSTEEESTEENNIEVINNTIEDDLGNNSESDDLDF
jgi:DNA gyrase subunit A